MQPTKIKINDGNFIKMKTGNFCIKREIGLFYIWWKSIFTQDEYVMQDFHEFLKAFWLGVFFLTFTLLFEKLSLWFYIIL